MKKILEKINKSSPGRKRLFYSLLCIFCLLVIAMLAFALYVGRVYFIKNMGINIAPRNDYPVNISSYYRQNDPGWSNQKIGSSSRNMGSTGCLISSVSTAITQLGYPVTPDEFNNKLNQVNGFQGADLIWYKINEAFPEIDYSFSRIFNNKTIEKDLEKGLLPIVNVKYYKTGVTHWVIIVGAKNGEFIICDPLGDGSSTKLLSDHGKVFAYRVIEKAQR